jgi:F-type H+-transporting ATPase subunit delta
MVTGALSRRYAKAILQIGVAQGNLDRIGADVRALAAAMKESVELQTVLANPAIRRVDRRRVVDAILARLGAQPVTKNFVALLLDGERLSSVPAISRELDAMIETRANRVSAEVVSAKPLNPTQVQQLTAALEKLAGGKKVDLARREDPSLLGGVLAKVGDVVYDGSLRTQLHNLADELTK